MNKNNTPQLNRLVQVESSETLVFAGIFTPGELVPIRSICENLLLDRKWQQERIQKDPLLSQLGGMYFVTAADGRKREMLCLTMKGLQEWLWSIQPTENSDYALLEKYRKTLAIDIQSKLIAMLKISLDEIVRLKSFESKYNLLHERVERMESSKLSWSEAKRLVREARKEFSQAEKSLIEELEKDPAQLELFESPNN